MFSDINITWEPIAGCFFTVFLTLVGMYILPSSYDHLQENISKYFWCCTRLAASVLKEVFLLIYMTLKTNNGHMSIGDYCNRAGVPSGNLFRNDELSKMRGDPVHTFMDVPFLCKILTDVLPRCNVKVPSSVKSIAHNLRQRRNKVCHEDIIMDDITLRKEFHVFEGLFSEALHDAGRKSGKNVDDRMQAIKEEMDKALTRTVLPDSKQLLSEVAQFRDGRSGSAISRTRRNLMSALRDFKAKDAEIKSFFQPMNKEKDLPKLEKGSSEISLRKLIVSMFKIRTSSSAAVLILWCSQRDSRRGLLHHLLREWYTKSEKIHALDSFDLVILIEGEGNQDQHLDDYKHNHISFNKPETKELLKEIKVLFLLDDVNPSSPILEELLEEFPLGHVILTSTSADRFKCEQMVHKSKRPTASIQLVPRHNTLSQHS